MPDLVDPFTPVRIVHVDLDGQPVVRAHPEERLKLFFWTDDRMVGDAEAVATVSGAVDIPALVPADLPAREPCGAVSEKVSVVICTRDRPEALARCLASLPAQSLRPHQVVVVDNASRDSRTRDVALSAGVTYVREDRPGLNIARNTGWAHATEAIVAYTDDDVELHERWLERLVGAFETPGIMAVTGLVVPASLETPAERLFEKVWGFGRGYRQIDFGRDFYARTREHGCPAWEVGAGANMGFRKFTFERLGGFDERLDVGAAGCSGDSEMWYRMLAAGMLCRYEPAAIVFHHHRKDIQALRQQIRAYMRGHAAALLVQYERTGDSGNLRRLFRILPAYYLRTWVGRLRHGVDDRNRLLGEEIRGLAEGVLYYLRASRPAQGSR